MPKIYIIHENEECTKPLKVQLRRLGLTFDEWYLNRGQLDPSVPPPLGVFYNRMSASSHTRNHRYAAEHTAAVLSWLEGYGIPTRAMNDAVMLLARLEGLLFDPVYSGKPLAGMIDLIGKGYFADTRDIIFVHTGGVAGLFGYSDKLVTDQ